MCEKEGETETERDRERKEKEKKVYLKRQKSTAIYVQRTTKARQRKEQARR